MIFTTSSVLLAALAGIARAQTPEGFKPSVNTKLDVMFNSSMVMTPGQLLTKAGTASQPQIAVSGAEVNSEDTYIFMMIDLDVPPAGSNTTRRTLLHALNTGFKATQQRMGGAMLLASTDKGPATYIGPSPPASDSTPHRYVELLFQQPETLEVQATDFTNVKNRIGFDVNAFMEENKLGEPLAANFFTVDGAGRGEGSASPSGTAAAGTAASGTGGSASGTGGNPERTPPLFDGAAGRAELTVGLLGLTGMLAVFGL